MVALIGFLLLIIPLAFDGLYAFVVSTLSKPKNLPPRDTNARPYLSIIIPTYNETKIIQRRVENLDQLNYPKDRFEAIFVDGASKDGTPEMIERLAADRRPFVRVIKQVTRQGYNAAIYEGICRSKADIVITGEAGSFFHPEGISVVAQHLADPAVGAATGRSELYNPNENLTTRLEASYRKAHDRLRFAESRLDSTPDMKGELLAFRKEIGLKLKPRESLPDNAAFDISLSYMTRRCGYRAIYDPDAIFYEYAPTSLKDRFIVQIRRGTAFTGAFWNFRGMALNRKFGYFGMLIAPSRFFSLILFPWMLLLAPIALLIELFTDPLVPSVMFALLGVALIVKKTRYILISFLLSQVVLAAGTLRLLFRRHTQIINTVPTARG